MNEELVTRGEIKQSAIVTEAPDLITEAEIKENNVEGVSAQRNQWKVNAKGIVTVKMKFSRHENFANLLFWPILAPNRCIFLHRGGSQLSASF